MRNLNDGDCADNTPAKHLSQPHFGYLCCRKRSGFLYGLRRIRAIKPNGNVATIYGDNYLSSTGTNAREARIGVGPSFIHRRNNGAIVFGDKNNSTLVEAEPDGLMYRIAGNGSLGHPNFGVDSITQPLNMEHPNTTGDSFALDPATGDIYRSADWRIIKLTRSSSAIGATGTWSSFSGGGANPWSSADGSADIDWVGDCLTTGYDPGLYRNPSCWIYPMPMAFGNGKLYVHRGDLTYRISDGYPSPRNSIVKLIDATNAVQSHLVGKVGVFNGIYGTSYETVCSPGTALSNCEFFPPDYLLRRAQPIYDSVGGRWLTSGSINGDIYGLPPGGNMQLVTSLVARPWGFTYKRSGANEYIYYCADGQFAIRRKHLQSGTDVALSWPVRA